MPRPMEVHAHDPLRYLGDMLAWVHQSLASERDLFVALFGTEGASAEAAGQGTSRLSDVGEIEPEDGEGIPDTAALLDRVFESVCRPLKVGRLSLRVLGSGVCGVLLHGGILTPQRMGSTFACQLGCTLSAPSGGAALQLPWLHSPRITPTPEP